MAVATFHPARENLLELFRAQPLALSAIGLVIASTLPLAAGHGCRSEYLVLAILPHQQLNAVPTPLRARERSRKRKSGRTGRRSRP